MQMVRGYLTQNGKIIYAALARPDRAAVNAACFAEIKRLGLDPFQIDVEIDDVRDGKPYRTINGKPA